MKFFVIMNGEEIVLGFDWQRPVHVFYEINFIRVRAWIYDKFGNKLRINYSSEISDNLRTRLFKSAFLEDIG